MEPSIRVGLSWAPLSVDAALAEVRQLCCGAIVIFLGTVRDVTAEMITEKLDYSAYEAMASKELEVLAIEAKSRWDLGGIVVFHRLGSLEPGEIAVVVAVSSPHRDGAFAAARFLIDETKHRVPLWKKEYGADGVAWIEGDARVPIGGRG